MQAKLAKFENTIKELDSTIELLDMLDLENDPESEAEVEEHVKALQKECEALSLETLLSGKYDVKQRNHYRNFMIMANP